MNYIQEVKYLLRLGYDPIPSKAQTERNHQKPAQWVVMEAYRGHNFAIKKIELDANDGIYYTSMGFQNLLANQGKKIGIPSHTIQGMLSQVHTAWSRCFKKIGD